jgi:hypothetical protein
MVELVYTYVSEAYASQLASSSLASGTLLSSRPYGSGSFFYDFLFIPLTDLQINSAFISRAWRRSGDRNTLCGNVQSGYPAAGI